MPVVDATGAAVGSVKAIQGENILLKPTSTRLFCRRTASPRQKAKLLFGMTQAQLNAEIEKGLAAADASVAAGATVKGVGGETVGAVDAATPEAVTITLTSGKKVQLSGLPSAAMPTARSRSGSAPNSSKPRSRRRSWRFRRQVTPVESVRGAR